MILTRAQAEMLYGDHVPPDVIVLIDVPARWPLDKPWPPRVTLPAPPCWRCVARPQPESPLARYFDEHPLGEVIFADA